MTLPRERSFAVYNTHIFLLQLCRPEIIPGIPKKVRETARRLLRHYPSTFDINQAVGGSEVFEEIDVPPVIDEFIKEHYSIYGGNYFFKRNKNEKKD